MSSKKRRHCEDNTSENPSKHLKLEKNKTELEIHSDIKNVVDKQPKITKNEETDEEIDEALITCDVCGYKYDGYAQCQHQYGYLNEDDEKEGYVSE